jgi:DNA polymerase III epsilon subunit-like protein
MSLLFYIIDTETTGLKADFHEMTEVGIVRCTDRLQLWRQIKCEWPERANFDALAITKKTLADLDKGLSREQVVEECERYFSEDGATPAHRCIVAHNAPFDRKFLHALWGQVGKVFPAHLWLDTMGLIRQYLKESGIEADRKSKGLKKALVNLHASCDWAGINKFSDAHNAKVDSRNTYLLYRDLVENKKIDYLPFIKTEVHQYTDPAAALAALDDDDSGTGLDPALLDI